MEIKKIFRKIFPTEISNIIQSYLIEEKLICRVCKKEYQKNFTDKPNQDLCPCYISWLYFSRDFENPWI